MPADSRIDSQKAVAGHFPTTVLPLNPEGTEITPEVEATRDFLGFVAEPWAAVVPMVGRTRLVSLSLARKVRSNLQPKKRILGKPTPFLRDYGDQIPFLPPNPAERTTQADLDYEAEYQPEVKGWIEAGVERHGTKKYLLQVDRARAYLRGSGFWRLRSGDALKPKQEGYPAGWLRVQAERHPDGKHNGPVDEAALLLAVQLEGLIAFPSSTGGWSVTR